MGPTGRVMQSETSAGGSREALVRPHLFRRTGSLGIRQDRHWSARLGKFPNMCQHPGLSGQRIRRQPYSKRAR